MLEAMLPGLERARAAGACPRPLRLIWFVFQGGTPDTVDCPYGKVGQLGLPEGIQNCFWPKSPGDITGADYKLTQILEPLDDLRGDILLVQHLHNYIASFYAAQEKYGKDAYVTNNIGDHTRLPHGFLTAMNPLYDIAPPATTYKSASAQKSCDQVAADALKQCTPLPSLYLATPSAGQYTNISWSDAALENSPIVTPSKAFGQVFSKPGGLDPKTIQKKFAYKRGVLDFVAADAASLRTSLGKADKMTLDQYLTSVKELEATIMRASALGSSCDGATEVADDSYVSDPGIAPQSIIPQWFKLLPAALQCDTTRVVVVNLDVRSTFFNWLPDPSTRYTEFHDDVEHGAAAVADPGEIKQRAQAYLQATRWIVEQFGNLVRALKAIPDPVGGGSILDNTIAVCTSEMSYGNGHDCNHLPVIIAGRGGGAVTTGRHILAPGGPLTATSFGPPQSPIANLWLSMLNAVGVDLTSFGNSTGPLSLRA